MDILNILQTVGICIGSIALVLIAFFLFLISGKLEDVFGPFELVDVDDEEDLRPARSRPTAEDIHRLLTTPVYDDKPRSRRKKKS